MKGVYGIKNKLTNKFEYIGQSIDVIQRILVHVSKWITHFLDYEFYLIYDCTDVDKNTQLYYETVLINKLNPKRNKSKQEYALKYSHQELEPIYKNITDDVFRKYIDRMM